MTWNLHIVGSRDPEDTAAVAEAIVIGRPARDIGSEIVAFLTLRTPITEQEIEMYCRARLAAEKLPARYLMMKELPRTANGKPDRAKIQEFAINYARQHGLS